MPIYDYKCQGCGKVFEVLLSASDKQSSPICPVCRSGKVERLPSAPNLLKTRPNQTGTTCCGREERCETPACSTGEGCRRR